MDRFFTTDRFFGCMSVRIGCMLLSLYQFFMCGFQLLRNLCVTCNMHYPHEDRYSYYMDAITSMHLAIACMYTTTCIVLILFQLPFSILKFFFIFFHFLKPVIGFALSVLVLVGMYYVSKNDFFWNLFSHLLNSLFISLFLFPLGKQLLTWI